MKNRNKESTAGRLEKEYGAVHTRFYTASSLLITVS
jgi:hypothetical protein